MQLRGELLLFLTLLKVSESLQLRDFCFPWLLFILLTEMVHSSPRLRDVTCPEYKNRMKKKGCPPDWQMKTRWPTYLEMEKITHQKHNFREKTRWWHLRKVVPHQRSACGLETNSFSFYLKGARQDVVDALVNMYMMWVYRFLKT